MAEGGEARDYIGKEDLALYEEDRGLGMVITKLDMFRQLQVADEEGVFDYTIANRAFW